MFPFIAAILTALSLHQVVSGFITSTYSVPAYPRRKHASSNSNEALRHLHLYNRRRFNHDHGIRRRCSVNRRYYSTKIYQHDDDDTYINNEHQDTKIQSENDQTGPKPTVSSYDETIRQQQQQIDMLMELVKNQAAMQQQHAKVDIADKNNVKDNDNELGSEEQQQSQIPATISPTSTISTMNKVNYKSSSEGDTRQMFTTNENEDAFSPLPPPLPGMFDEEGEEELTEEDDTNMVGIGISDFDPYVSPPQQTTTSGTQPIDSLPNFHQHQQRQLQAPMIPLAPFKVMLFIDGTWLYYSLHRRREQDDPIVKKFGRGWQYRYRFDWSALPRIICEQLAGQQINMGWSSTGSVSTMQSSMDDNTSQSVTSSSLPTAPNFATQQQRPMEIVRASVFTSYKKSTDPSSIRVKMYNEMANANYDVHMLESFGNGPEKCVDISLAVEMLHYATVPNAYDIAILLSGDKDFIPALVRTRQKGRKVGIVSMKTGCNRALYESAHVKDFDVVWIDDFLDKLIVPLPADQVGKQIESVYDRGLLSVFTITKVILDFIAKSPSGKVSSRDVGRYLKGLVITEGTNLLDDLKLGQGGLRRFLQDRMPEVFTITDVTSEEAASRDPRDKSYWVEQKSGDAKRILLDEAKTTKFSSEEKQFLRDYEAGLIGVVNVEEDYYHTVGTGRPQTSNSFYTPRDIQVADEISEYIPPDLQVDYSSYTVPRLKERCRERGLPVSGTKAVLLERIEKDVSEQIQQLKTQKASSQTQSVDTQITKHVQDLIKYYINQNGGTASSRNIGRYLSANAAYDIKDESSSFSMDKRETALQQLKDNFGSLAAFLNHRDEVFSVNHNNGEDSFSFDVSLRGGSNTGQDIQAQSIPTSFTSNNASTLDQYLEELIEEYIAASGGHASSRNVGRFLAANSAFRDKDSNQIQDRRNNQTALQQLKENYGSLANFLTLKRDIFSIVRDYKSDDEFQRGPDFSFGVRSNKHSYF